MNYNTSFLKKKERSKEKLFYVAKKKHLSESEIKKTNKNLNQLEKSSRFKKFHGNIDSVDYDYNYYFANDDDYRKIGSISTLFKEFDRDY